MLLSQEIKVLSHIPKDDIYILGWNGSYLLGAMMENRHCKHPLSVITVIVIKWSWVSPKSLVLVEAGHGDIRLFLVWCQGSEEGRPLSHWC